MQRLYEIGFPSSEHIPALKSLWATVFKDGEQVIDSFFENTQENINTICAFCEGKPVSMLFAVESEILCRGESYSACYVYAVCTHPDHRGKGLMKKTMSFLETVARDRGASYLYLVPAEESLFSLYGTLGYQTAFFYDEIVVNAPQTPAESIFSFGVDYDFYRSLRLKENEAPIVILGEKGFKSFVSPKPTAEAFAITVEGKGCAVVELINGTFTIQELWGDENTLLACVFNITKADSIFLRNPTNNGGTALGMVKSLDGSPVFENGFIGSYGG